MAGRPKRGPAVLHELIRLEFGWQIVFSGLREGLPGWDNHLPNPETAGLKWLRSSKQHYRSEDEKEFWDKHFARHLQEADKEFTEKIILAPPRDAPSEPELWKALSDPQNGPKKVRDICVKSKVLRFLFGRPRSMPLYEHAREFCRAKRDKRYPHSDRPSSESKRVDYLARVMAGLRLQKPIAPATAVDILRKMKHKRACPCWRCYVRRFSRRAGPTS